MRQRAAYNDLGKVGKNIVGKDNLKLLTNAEKALGSLFRRIRRTRRQRPRSSPRSKSFRQQKT
ncbi:MAG: hypothetical protein ACLR8U_01655 [Oscillospiraceae bacterium]